MQIHQLWNFSATKIRISNFKVYIKLRTNNALSVRIAVNLVLALTNIQKMCVKSLKSYESLCMDFRVRIRARLVVNLSYQ